MKSFILFTALTKRKLIDLGILQMNKQLMQQGAVKNKSKSILFDYNLTKICTLCRKCVMYWNLPHYLDILFVVLNDVYYNRRKTRRNRVAICRDYLRQRFGGDEMRIRKKQ